MDSSLNYFPNIMNIIKIPYDHKRVKGTRRRGILKVRAQAFLKFREFAVNAPPPSLTNKSGVFIMVNVYLENEQEMNKYEVSE